jgi:hypothetical protein
VKLYIDLESRELIEAPGFRNPVTTLRFKRGDSAKLEVAFLTDRTTYTSLGDAEAITMRFGVKQSNRFDLDFLAYCADWIMPGEEDVSPVYVCYPSFNTAGLDAALDVGENPEIASLTLMGEITWSVGDGEPTSTRTFVVIVENDVIRGNESGPSGITAGIPTNATLEIAGTLSPDVTGFVDCYIDTDGNLAFTEGAIVYSDVSYTGPAIVNNMATGKWSIYDVTAGVAAAAGFSSIETVLVAPTPNLATWTNVGGSTGTSEVTIKYAPTSGHVGTMKVAAGTLYVCVLSPSGMATWQKATLSAHNLFLEISPP